MVGRSILSQNLLGQPNRPICKKSRRTKPTGCRATYRNGGDSRTAKPIELAPLRDWGFWVLKARSIGWPSD